MKKRYKHFINTLALLILLNNVTGVAFASVLEPGTIETIYNVKYQKLISGTLTQKIEIKPNHQYQFDQKISSSFIFFKFGEHEVSQGLWFIAPSTIKPLSYDFYSNNTSAHYQFNWKKHQVHYQAAKENGKIAMPAMVYDQLSCQLLLRIALENGVKELYCPYIKGKKIKQFHFEIIGHDTILFQHKNYHVQKVVQNNPSNPTGKLTIFWVSPELSYVPLRVTQYKNNKQISVAELSDIHF